MDKTVSIYSTPTCHFCQMAKDFLKENNIAYTEFNVAQDLEKRQEMIQRSGQMGVPVIVVGDPSNSSGQVETIVGFDQEKLAAALGIKE
jgi:glutaredoxin-like YruB-family protein